MRDAGCCVVMRSLRCVTVSNTARRTRPTGGSLRDVTSGATIMPPITTQGAGVTISPTVHAVKTVSAKNDY